MSSQVTQALVAMLERRDALGRQKYGVTLDRRDLTPEQWLQHLTEELLDGAGYAQAALREIGEANGQRLKAELFDYLCWLEVRTQPEELRGKEFLVLASDGTTCWGGTYAGAVRRAMEHDKGLGTGLRYDCGAPSLAEVRAAWQAVEQALACGAHFHPGTQACGCKRALELVLNPRREA